MLYYVSDINVPDNNHKKTSCNMTGFLENER